MLGGTFRESITTTVNNEFLPQLKDPIKKFICNLPVGDMLGQIKDVATGKKSIKDVTGNILGKAGSAISKAGKSVSGASSAAPKETSAADKLFR